MAIFAVSDWHLGETRLDLLCRPFVDAEEQTMKLVINHNSVVDKDDYVYVLGDIIRNKDYKSYLPFVKRFNGHKILVRGNHDRAMSDEILSEYFDLIIPEGEGVELRIDPEGQEPVFCLMNHYPTLARPDRFNLVGHIHGAWKVQLNMLNVSVDVHHFYPVNLDRVPWYVTAISEFYDEDVWVADLPANADWKATRGKKTRYFEKK